uniref:IQ motif containing GTPase activating protein 2 n=1 Tax=Salmo trutta TaxID=8032 RepID=A0A674EPB0_SALTR
MDERRRQNIAYEYLCHLEEAKQWMEACVEEELPPTTELEEGLRNGVYLGKLAKFFAPKMVSEKKIYDRDQTRYKHTGLHFRHTDNTVQWLRAMESVGLPKIFYPETTDVYDRKNMPKVVYCIHALSLYLFKLGIAPQIQDLLGKVAFTEEEISNMRSELEKYGIQMPTFSKIGGILANELSVDEAALHAAVFAINEAVDKGEATVTMGALKNPNAMLRNTGEELAQDYQVTLSWAKASKEDQASGRVRNSESLPVVVLSTQESVKKSLSQMDEAALLAGLRVPALGMLGVQEANSHWYLEHLTSYCEVKARVSKAQWLKKYSIAIVAINAAIRHGVAAETVEELMNPEAQLPIVYQTAANLYQTELFSLQIQGAKAGLGHEELCVAVEMLSAVAALNEVLDTKDPQAVTEQLTDSPLGFSNMDQDNLHRYADTLISLRAESLSQGLEFLTWNDVQKTIDTVNLQVHEEHERIIAIAEINEAEVAEGDSQTTLQALQSPLAGLRGVLSECTDTYQTQLAQRQDLNTTTGNLAYSQLIYGCLFSCQHTPSLTNKYITFPISSVIYISCVLFPLAGSSDSVWVKHRIKESYDYYYNLENREGTWEEPEDFTHNSTQLRREEIQCVVGGVTAEYNREQLWLANETLVTQLQARIRVKQEFHIYNRLNVLQSNVGTVIKIYTLLSCLYVQEKEIVKIQAFLKANKARDDYRTLTGAQDPPLSVVRKFVHLLEQSSLDLLEEQEVTRLREEVVTKIRSNQQMEKDLNLMDIKIGLLVKNRITLQDVVSHSKKLKKKSKEELAAGDRQGIKGLSKGKRKKLEAYQHLFYLLQTNPSYLAKLIFQMPQNKSTKFMDTVIFTLYNYASNQREEYLLLKLFKTALEEEIKSKVDQIQDIVTGNPTVIKMVVSFNRGARGHNTLRQLLAPVVKEIIEDKGLGINTNPVDVYKAWVNQLETNTGEASKLPYEVTPDQAMSHKEVRAKLESSSQALRTATDKVLNSIVSSLDNIPYGMRYIAKVLKHSLHEKFPDATEDELLKIVGNLLYYRYMNPAIVAPDGFDIIDMSAGGQLHSDQRRNLGSVAKMLQHAAANKLFEGENAHMTSMNNYISQTYQKFRVFFQAACDVPEPEEKFNVDEYSDMVTLSKPVIYISIDEIINTHSLVLEHLEAISPDHNDLLHELLEDLGDAPDVEALLGEGAVDPNHPNKESTLSQLAKTEISLTLTSKFELLEGDDKDTKGLMMKTKKLIVDVIRIQPGDTLPETLETPASALQECEHSKVVALRAVQDAQTPEGLKSSQAVLEDRQLPLEQKKRKILRNLRTLEQAGLVTASNKYQDLINDIAKDIRYQRRYRQRRKAELVKLQQALMFPTKPIPQRKVEEKGSKKWKHQSLKYTAARLHEKGVILEIEGLQTNQFKNVMFDISPSEEVGDFEVKAKFMGVEMEKVQLHFQDLLQLQYEGVAVMKMFDKAKVNVNLLIFLLNKKFYGK